MDMFRIHGIAANPAPSPGHAGTFGRRSTRRYGRRLAPADAAGEVVHAERERARADAAAAGDVDQYFEEYFFE